MTSVLTKQEREDLKRQMIQEFDEQISIRHRFLVLFLAVCALFKPGFVFFSIAIPASQKTNSFAGLGAMLKDLADTED